MRQTSLLTTLNERVGTAHTVAAMIIPPDGGWGWVIVLTGFIAAVITDGVCYGFYLFREPVTQELHAEPGDISFLSALFTGFYFIGGIIACSVGNYFGFRVVMIVGAAVLCVTFASGYILEDMFYFYLNIGFIGGMAGGFVFVAGMLPSGFYFDKKRSIAMGLVSCGSGVGAIVLPQATEIIMDRYGWRLTYLFYASLFAMMMFLGFLIRPLKPVMVVIRPSTWTAGETSVRNSSLNDLGLYRIPTQDALSVAASSFVQSVVLSTRASTHPTITQVAQDMDDISIRVRDSVDQSMILKLQGMTQSRNLQLSASVIMPRITIEQDQHPQLTRLPWYKCGCCRKTHQLTMPERPMLRTDLYYTGSLNRLDEYISKDKEMEYHMHVTKVPTYFEMVNDLSRTYGYWCCRNILHGIKSLLNYSLLKSPTFLCLALCGFATYTAFFLPFLYGKVRLENIGKGDYATTLVTMIGLGNMIGRISSGIIVTTIPKFGARTTVSFTSFIAALSVICSVFYNDLSYQFGCMFVYGFTVGFFAPLRSIIIVDFMGLDALTSATGMMILFQGCGSFIGAPLAEAVMAYTQNESSAHYLCGGALVFASMILWPMRKIQRWEKIRKEQKSSRLSRRPQTIT